MKCFGLTGGIGTGKGVATKLLRQKNIPVIDADELAREVVAKESEGLEQVVAKFGASFLNSEGELNRESLAKLIFADKKSRLDLETIVHPLIAAKRNSTTKKLIHAGYQSCVFSAPLLFETGMEKDLSGTVLLIANRDLRIKRITERDKISIDEAVRRIDTQMPDEEKQKLATVTIKNNGTVEELAHKISDAWKTLTGETISFI